MWLPMYLSLTYRLSRGYIFYDKDLGLIKNKDNLAVVEPNVEILNISSRGDPEISIPMDMYQKVAETSDIQNDLELTVNIPGVFNSKEIEDNIEDTDSDIFTKHLNPKKVFSV